VSRIGLDNYRIYPPQGIAQPPAVYYIPINGADECIANDGDAKFVLAKGTEIGMGRLNQTLGCSGQVHNLSCMSTGVTQTLRRRV